MQTKKVSSALAKRIADAKAVASREFLTDGDYVLAVRRFVNKTGASAGFKGDSIVLELKVVESKAQAGRGAPLAPGTLFGRVFKLTGDSKFLMVQYGKLKSAVLAITGSAPDIDASDLADTVDALIGDEQIARGVLVKNATVRNGDFVNDAWTHVEQTDEQVAAIRRELDAANE
jgi:hypothetical protein